MGVEKEKVQEVVLLLHREANLLKTVRQVIEKIKNFKIH
jgi:hypothetical protein